METIEIQFLAERWEDLHVHSDVEVFYILEGSGEFILEDQRYQMKKGDFIVVNSNQKHGFRTTDERYLGAGIRFPYLFLCRTMNRETIFFYCNSVQNENEIMEELRALLKKIINEQYRNPETGRLHLLSLCFELLHILTTDFLVSRNDSRFQGKDQNYDGRKALIAEYVQMNYNRDISLMELAEKLYLSNTYLSRYIKRQFHMTFIEYVNSVRLDHAVAQLLYSDQPLVHIAMENGFASSAAFNKVFKEKYQMSPTEYRNLQKQSRDGKNVQREEEQLRKRVQDFFTEAADTGEKKTRQLEEYVNVSGPDRKPLENIWTKMINIGTAAELLHSDMQQHVLYLKNKLHFQYVRFWDLYSQEVFMQTGQADGQYNFDKLDRILDFLMKNDLKPYMELRIKPKVLIQSQMNRLQNQEIAADPDAEYMQDFMKKLAIHLIRRYTVTEIEKWYFEVWKTEEYYWQNKEMSREEKEKTIYLYLDVFDNIAGTLRKYLPNIRIGGGGFALRYGEEHFLDILRLWKERENLPDFVSVYCYPYTAEMIYMGKNQTLDVDFVKKDLRRVRELMKEAEFPVEPLHVTEWSFSMSSRSVLNDHCMKGAYLLKNMIDSIGQADLMGYWVGSDLFADHYDSRWLLNGGGGLISKDGIPKPAFYALEFINHLGRYLIKTGDHYVISDNGQGNYRIVCHNLKTLGYQYNLLQEDQIRRDEVNNLFTDLQRLNMHFNLEAARSGKYTMRMFSISQKFGSIQDLWKEVNVEGEMTPEDIRYLERITTPRLQHRYCEEKGGKLRFDVELEPNEMKFIHISYTYM